MVVSSKTPAVGADIESICGKCGDVWHVVVAKVGDKIVKVHCKQCGATHRYSPPAAVREREKQALAAAREAARDAARAGRPAPAPRAASSGGGTRASRAAAVVANRPLVNPDPLRPSRKYKPSETYLVADVIEHPTFGRGVVELIPMPGKIQVYFHDGRRTLVAGKQEVLLPREQKASGERRDDDAND